MHLLHLYTGCGVVVWCGSLCVCEFVCMCAWERGGSECVPYTDCEHTSMYGCTLGGGPLFIQDDGRGSQQLAQHRRSPLMYAHWGTPVKWGEANDITPC
jgi:hypothetical protein